MALQVKCHHCGELGTWSKCPLVYLCPDCAGLLRHHHNIRLGFYVNCDRPGGTTCDDQTSLPPCASCAEYFASETYAFLLAHSRSQRAAGSPAEQ